jgi:regulator of protease activity HflC (stomatin/prohibitin superfamily)
MASPSSSNIKVNAMGDDEEHKGHPTRPLFNAGDPVPENCYTGSRSCCGGIIGCLGAIPFCFCCPNPYKRVQQGEVALVKHFGRFTKAVPPGLIYLNPMTESMTRVNTKIQVQALPQQVIFTRDNVYVSVDSVLYWRIFDAPTATYMVDNVANALVERAQITMREVCSVRELQDMLTHRDAMADEIKNIIEPIAHAWGIEIESILIKDIKMDSELQENLSAAAVAKRQGASKVIAAQAEVEAAKLMREASDILSTPAAMQFRYLETLQRMASHAQSRVIFVPTSMTDINRFSTASVLSDPNEGALTKY